MGQVFVAFGVDWRLLIINLINFGILLLALWYFLYGPLMKTLETRREKIAQGVIDAENAGARLNEIESARSGMIADAGKEADKLVADARSTAVAKGKELVISAETAAANVLKNAEAQANEMKTQAIAESKQEVAKLIVLGMEKITLRQAQGKN